ncbi:MAG: histidine kinase [Bacteroidia bacterium]|nr:histidine kinase [Bacteroidia bacterium]
MTKAGWIWPAILGACYLGLILMVGMYLRESAVIQQYEVDPEIRGDFEGNDWVTWENTDKGVIAAQVHPLTSYKPYDKDLIRQGDRVRKLDFNEVADASVIETITSSSRPGKAFSMILERTDPTSLVVSPVEIIFINGFRLPFSFNQYPFYWHTSGWLWGIGAFIALVILAILVPLVRSNWRDSIPLLGIVVMGLLLFLIQLLHHIYLIVESDLENVRVERVYIMVYMILLFLYSGCYFYFKAGLGARRWYLMIPSVAAGAFLLWQSYEVLYVSLQVKFFLRLLESGSIAYCLIHIGGGAAVSLWSERGRSSRRVWLGLGAILILTLGALVYYLGWARHAGPEGEHFFFLYCLLLFFPLGNATFLQLQFGKVSLVITQTIQYLVAFVVGLVVYLLVSQLFDLIRINLQYRRLLEFATFLLIMAALRLIYLANEGRFSRYFVSAQREQLSKFRAFIARIPQYTSVSLLRDDLRNQLRDFFNAEQIEFWWKEEEPGTPDEVAQYQFNDRVYQALNGQQAVWSQTKELSPLRLEEDAEKQLLKSPYSLISPITVDKDNYALLELGRKRRGVYNLSDLELISQLIQQTQLTLNVLQLVQREKELIQQTYEANLTALRSQINPHFLFNTLNSIGELVHESPKLAEQAIEKLAFIFRYTLKMSSQNFVPLSSEMNLITTYLDLEKIRFGERLDTHIEIEPDIKEVPIPAFILSTLVENCIKHGISKILHKGLVSVEAFRDEDFLVCEVVDNGPGIDMTRIHKSTGLSNSLARLENIYDRKNLLYFENTGQGTYVRLKIPLGDKA